MKTLPFLRRAALLALACAACSRPAPPAGPAPEEPVPEPMPTMVDPANARVELLWDEYGVPHVFARDPVALFYAFGWAQMRSHGDLVLRLYGQARGRAAEYWGPEYVESDTWVRVNAIPPRADQWWAEQRPHMRAYLEGFVAGMNAYVERNPELIGEAWKAALPIQATDVLAHAQRVVHFSFLANPRMALVARQQLQASPGSNAWAIGRARSASGNTLLLANPHLPWADIFTLYEAHLALPDLNAYGATLVGMPILAFAFNDHIGWTHTVNTIDGADLYDLETRGDGYIYNDDMRPFEIEQQTLRVRQPDGSMAERPLVIRRSLHGPVIAERAGRAIALRVAGIDEANMYEQYWNMLTATNRASFEASLSRLQAPMFTVMYADRAGDILHVFNGRVPIRQRGDWSYWQGLVPGGSGETLWHDTHPYMDLPRVLNPTSGWLQNANDPPWTTTLPLALEPSRYPPYMAPQRPPAFRPLRSLRMLAEDSRITFDELVEYKHSTRMGAADHLLSDLIAAARSYGDDDARAAADVLERWDRTADAGARGAVLFAQVYRVLQRQRWPNNSMFEVPWTPSAPLATPDGLSEPRLAAVATGEAARQVRATYGALDVAWGDVFRFRRDTLDLPANGGDGGLGIFRVIDFEPAPGDSTRFFATGGDSFVAAVEFSTPVRAMTVLAYGNASQPGSPHRTDQLALAARKEMKPVLFSREAVLAAGVALTERF